MKRFNKVFPIVLGLVILFVAIFIAFVKVNRLESAKKEMSTVAGNAVERTNGKLKKVQSSDYILGNTNAPVTLIEYSDFECPQCQEFHPTLKKLMNEYQGKVRLITRMFPLPQNSNAEKEAEATECAGNLGGSAMFWKYGDDIFARTSGVEGGKGFPLSRLVPLAKELGIKEENFKNCLDSNQMASRVASDKQNGEDAGVNALPALFVQDAKGHTLFLSGNQSYPVIQAVVDESLAQF